MPINNCSINACTIDSNRCRNPALVRPSTGVFGTNNSSIRDTFARRFPNLPRPFEIDDRPELTFEQPFVTVTAMLLGSSGTQQLEMTQQVDFVMVTNLKFDSDTADPVVNISNFRID